MNWRTIFYVLGFVISGVGILMVIPSLYSLINQEEHVFRVFFLAMLATISVGVVCILSNRQPGKLKFGRRDAFFLTFVTWISSVVFASLPIYGSISSITYVNSLFEATSAITTTGMTTLTKLDLLPESILLWRSMLQWLGGIGIIVMAITILPILRIGGMQLFQSEFSDQSEKILPRVSQITSNILYVYSSLTIIGVFALHWSGMSLFDAICHSLTSISTGGLSTHDIGILAYDSWLIEMVMVMLMIFGSLTFVTLVKLKNEGLEVLASSSQLKVFLRILIVSTLLLSLILYLNGMDLEHALRSGIFTGVSIITTSGFVQHDYMHFGPLFIAIIFFLSFIGGCTGSTTGGIKVFRFEIISRYIRNHINSLYRPFNVFVPIYQGKKISDLLISSVFTFVSLYFITITCTTLLLSFFGLDFISSISGAVACIGNVGPGLGEIVGPTCTLADVPESAKIVMMVAMVLGRLELITVYAMLTFNFWKR